MANELDVLVFGSANVDIITYMKKLPQPGETLKAMHRENFYGGKGANQCVAAARLGAKCAFIAKLGNDDAGVEYHSYLAEMGIDVEHVHLIEDCATGLAQINVDDNAENTIVVLPGANTFLTPTDVTRAKELFKRAQVLVCQLETEEKAVLAALRQFKGISILNVSPASADLNVELIKLPTILCINELEAAQLISSGKIVTLQDAKAAAIELLEMGANSVIITMGAMGAVYLSAEAPDSCTHCPAAPVRYLADTSGAGDAFLGSLAYHIARFPNLCRESHINAANVCAAYSVGRRGTQSSYPGPEYAQENLCQIKPLYTLIDDVPEPAEETDFSVISLESAPDVVRNVEYDSSQNSSMYQDVPQENAREVRKVSKMGI